jgi:hypothetical protein
MLGDRVSLSGRYSLAIATGFGFIQRCLVLGQGHRALAWAIGQREVGVE